MFRWIFPNILYRPSLWVGMIAFIVYWDNQCLFSSNWVYDDSGSVAKNVVVIGQVPWMEVFTRDFWGTTMKELTSHKSFRPLTTLTFRLNYLWNTKYSTDRTHNDDPGLDITSYKLVNVLMHAVVCILVTEAAGYIFYATHTQKTIKINENNDGKENTKKGEEEQIIPYYYNWREAQVMTGVLFAIHPVHAEVVSNVTSRGEMLMSIFSLMAFLSYARAVTSFEEERSSKFFSVSTTLGVYVFPVLGMALSLFSKEQGATTLITLIVWDFCRQFESIQSYFEELVSSSNSRRTWYMLRRTVLLAMQTLALCGYRYWLNGETSPDFIEDQNPAGFASDRFTRIFSICWVYCLYIRDAVYPKFLCPDWSGRSIRLIRDSDDERIWGVILLWVFAFACVVSLVIGHESSFFGTSEEKEEEKKKKNQRQTFVIVVEPKWYEHPARRIILSAFFGFTFAPFLLSSNLLVVIGLMKADRVIYLPLLGFCVIQALIFQLIWNQFSTNNDNNKSNVTTNTTNSSSILLGCCRTIFYWIYLIQILLYTAKTHERNIAWHHSLNLWLTAYQINPVSHHTMYNCGYELSIKQRYEEAEYVMRPIGDPHVDGPSNTFVYAMVLYNLKQCEIANVLIDKAMDILQEQRDDTENIRNQPHMIDRSESNILVARAHCVMGNEGSVTVEGMIAKMQEKGSILYQAVQVDPTNNYAIQQAQGMMKQMEQLQKAGYSLN